MEVVPDDTTADRVSRSTDSGVAEGAREAAEDRGSNAPTCGPPRPTLPKPFPLPRLPLTLLPMILTPGTRLGPYRILAPLGSGGMGEVYRAHDDRLGRDVAIKVITERLAATPEARARFEREARAASALNHPNIITIYEIGQQGPTTFIAMEWIEGKTLGERLASGAMPLEELLHVAAQVAAGLSKAHQAGIVHRDLKPGNIMVTEDGVVKILDFGLAKLTEPPDASPSDATTRDLASTRMGVLVGTPAYMSPEQVGGRPADFRSDQFSLGLVLYEMATGKGAFARATDLQTIAALLSEPVPPIRSSSPDIPKDFEAVVTRCLQKNPDSRYATTGELAKELEHIRLRHAVHGARPGGSGPRFASFVEGTRRRPGRDPVGWARRHPHGDIARA